MHVGVSDDGGGGRCPGGAGVTTPRARWWMRQGPGQLCRERGGGGGRGASGGRVEAEAGDERWTAA
jgi:hypothetical protein